MRHSRSESIARELARLEQGLPLREKPAGIGLVTFVVTAASDMQSIISRAKKVLSTVDKQIASSPSENAWRRILPTWFVERCAPERSPEEAEAWLARWRALSPTAKAEVEETDPWSLLNWLYWFEPKQREWFWWDAVITDERSATVLLEVRGWPFPWGAFAWLLRAAGAESVRSES